MRRRAFGWAALAGAGAQKWVRPTTASAALGPRAAALVAAFTAAWDARDLPALVSLFTQDAELRFAVTSAGRVSVLNEPDRIGGLMRSLIVVPFAWSGPTELAGRVRWSGVRTDAAESDREDRALAHPPLWWEAEPAPDGRIARLYGGAAEAELDVAREGAPEARPVPPAPLAAPAPWARVGPSEGDFRPAGAGIGLAVGALLLARLRGR